MRVRLTDTPERGLLFDIWFKSVRATHDFVSDDDIEAMIPQVREYVTSAETEFWVVCNDEVPFGFMGLGDGEIESIFIHPDYQRQGGGRLLVEHAQSTHDGLIVDVNEQNVGAVSFYQRFGFVVAGRSELDGQGRHYPILHMRWP